MQTVGGWEAIGGSGVCVLGVGVALGWVCAGGPRWCAVVLVCGSVLV